MGATEEPQTHRGPPGTSHTGWGHSAGDTVAAPEHCPQGMGTSTEVYPSQPSQRQTQLRAAPPEGSPAPEHPPPPALLPVTHTNPQFLCTGVYSELTLRDKQVFPLPPHTLYSIILNINKHLVLGAWQLHRQQSASWCKVGDQPCPFPSWDHLAPVSWVQIQQGRR